MRHDGSDAGTDEVATAGKSAGAPSTAPSSTSTTPPSSGITPDASAACGRVCSTCAVSTFIASCDAFCATILKGASEAGCSAALASLLECQDVNKAGCATELCPTQNNALTACILEYCDSYPTSTVCESAL